MIPQHDATMQGLGKKQGALTQKDWIMQYQLILPVVVVPNEILLSIKSYDFKMT